MCEPGGALSVLKSKSTPGSSNSWTNSRFQLPCRFGSVAEKEQGQQICRELLKLYDDIEQRQGDATEGLPPLSEDQRLRFREDAFDAFLLAAKVEGETGSKPRGPTTRTEPPSRDSLCSTGRSRFCRAGTSCISCAAECWKKLGNSSAEAADIEKARTIRAGPPILAVDRFWRRAGRSHGRGEEARQKGDPEKVSD